MNTLESLSGKVDKILVFDRGSHDKTLSICQKFGAQITKTFEKRHLIRNGCMSQDWNMLIQPWEVLSSNLDFINGLSHGCFHSTIIENKIISKEIRLWKGSSYKFTNPVFETIDSASSSCPLLFYSAGRSDHLDILEEIDEWKTSDVHNAAPYYYQACILFSLGRYQEFLTHSEYCMHLHTTPSISNTMNRYYYSLSQLIYKKDYKKALQNVNLCLCDKPLMAEFWCLTGDIYYHLLNRFEFAKEFYENAMILGSKRLQSDLWPMDLTKYRSYPEKMIESCNSIISRIKTGHRGG